MKQSIFSLKNRFFLKKSIFFIITLDSGNPICASYSFENVSVGEIWGVGNLGEWGKFPGESCGENMGKYWGNQGGIWGKIWANMGESGGNLGG